MQSPPTHLVLAYYHFCTLENPHAEVKNHQDFLAPRDATCRIYISEQGINGQFCATYPDAVAYMEWLKGQPAFKDVSFKIHPHHEQVYPRKTIKYRRLLVAIEGEVDLSKRGESLSPKRWREMLDGPEKPLLIDVRNDYEWKIGRFEGATLPACETFREFKEYADQLKKSADPKNTPVMMYCTGGIRCELFSAILREKGFEKVYQLEGGVIGYGLEEGSAHWLGKLFVFDDRMAVPISEEEGTPIVGSCLHCQTPNEAYYNCANMDCNALFLCCPTCLKEYAGCCSHTCKNAPRLRPFHELNPHKPFRRRSQIASRDASESSRASCVG